MILSILHLMDNNIHPPLTLKILQNNSNLTLNSPFVFLYVCVCVGGGGGGALE